MPVDPPVTRPVNNVVRAENVPQYRGENDGNQQRLHAGDEQVVARERYPKTHQNRLSALVHAFGGSALSPHRSHNIKRFPIQ